MKKSEVDEKLCTLLKKGQEILDGIDEIMGSVEDASLSGILADASIEADSLVDLLYEALHGVPKNANPV